MSLRIVVMGAGAIGSLFGGFLAEGNNDVTLVGRNIHVNAIKQSGLMIEKGSKKRVIQVKAVSSPTCVKAPVDLLILTVKAYDTKEAIMTAQTFMDRHTILLCLQNGWGIETIASEIVEKNRVLRGVTMNGAQLEKPGSIIYTGSGETIIGSLDGNISKDFLKGWFIHKSND